MIDLHCHILPGVDDGAANLAQSLEMANKAVEQGITHILCTPHHNSHFQNNKNKIISDVALLQKELDQRNISIKLFEGQEVRITQDLIAKIKADQILFADLRDQYLTLEFPTKEIPRYAEDLCYQLRKKEIVPIIVHPERNYGFQANPNQLMLFLNMGCLAQVTAVSLVGEFGRTAQKLGLAYVKHNLVQMTASDAHALKNRNFYLKEAYQIIEKEFGQKKVQDFKQTATDIINGDQVEIRNYSAINE